MEFKEFSGKDIEDAITNACQDFLVASDMLEYEVVEQGSAGFLGIGAKRALIKARVKSVNKAMPAVKVKSEKSSEVKPANNKPAKANVSDSKPADDTKKEVKSTEAEASADNEEKPARRKAAVDVNQEELIAAADKFLKDVFAAMKISVSLKYEFIASDAELLIELSGDDMGILIGKRGQTLDSIQYLTSLVINKGNAGYVRVKVDTEDYRRRRKETLENLAKNLSYKVKRTHKSVALEPMNPYERRIIHSSLQSDKFVSTHSEGEEPFRRVVLTPKRDRN